MQGLELRVLGLGRGASSKLCVLGASNVCIEVECSQSLHTVQALEY